MDLRSDAMNSPLSRRSLLTASSGLLILDSRTVRGSQANSAISVGLVGCGRRGLFDAQSFAKNEHAKIAAIYDVYDDQIANAGNQFAGASRHKRYQEVLGLDLDAVIIATPPYLRPGQF